MKPLPALFAVTGSKAIATRVLAERTWPTPTPPTPGEPLSSTRLTPSAGGWTVQKAQLLGTSDNSLGAIAGSSPADIWAVGNFLPDAAKANQDATLTFAEHYDGKQWTVVRTPNAGPDFDTLFGVAASQGRAWVVGVRQNGNYADRALIETWNGQKWSIADNPQPGSSRDMLFGASALSPADVWAVGDQEGGNGVFRTLYHWTALGITVPHLLSLNSTVNFSVSERVNRDTSRLVLSWHSLNAPAGWSPLGPAGLALVPLWPHRARRSAAGLRFSVAGNPGSDMKLLLPAGVQFAYGALR